MRVHKHMYRGRLDDYARSEPGGRSVDVQHPTLTQLEAAWQALPRSPRDAGRLEQIVRRPQVGEREVLDMAELDVADGLVGDNWRTRRSSRTPDGSPHPDMQLTLMNARVIAMLAGDRERWALAGDQLFVDLDLSAGNLPAGTRLELGTAVIQVTEPPHTGCKKLMQRYGQDALRFLSDRSRQAERLRGIYTRVVRSGTMRAGDPIRKVS